MHSIFGLGDEGILLHRRGAFADKTAPAEPIVDPKQDDLREPSMFTQGWPAAV
jgi:hypothetical protein